jgi:hypothetical protein
MRGYPVRAWRGFGGARVAAALLLLAVVIVVPLRARAQATVLEVVDLAYRNAAEVVPILKPLVGPEGSVSAINKQLVIRATPRNMAEIRKVLAAIDKRPRRLLVTVSQDVDFSRNRSGAEVRGTVSGDNASVTLPGKPGPQPPGAAAGGAQARVYSSQSAGAERSGQSVQVLEGNNAFIATGASAPINNRQVITGPGGTRVIESTQFVDALAGFNVRPRTTGDRVTIEIAGSRNQFAARDQAGRDLGGRDSFSPPGTVNVQRYDTVVSGRLGEWIELGGITGGAQFEEDGVSYRSRDASRDARRWYIKVEELR